MRSEVGSGATDPAATHESAGGTPVPLARATPTIIEPIRGWPRPDLRELLRYRELLYFLVWRSIKVRYKQTAIGAGWAVLQPLVAMVVFTLIFGNLLDIPSDGLPYPVFAYVALLPWTYFSTALTGASGSLVYDANLVSKVYFPRLLIPLSFVVVPAVDFAIAFGILIVMMLGFGILPGAQIVVLPLFLLLAFVTALGFGLWLAAINVRYRDVMFAVPFLVQVWLFLTPVAYPSSVVPEQWRALYGLNPMVAVIDGFRWALLGAPPPGLTVLLSTLVVIVVLVSGLLYFGRTESHFADIV